MGLGKNNNEGLLAGKRVRESREQSMGWEWLLSLCIWLSTQLYWAEAPILSFFNKLMDIQFDYIFYFFLLHIL